jgi:hypothetical protein
MAFYNRLMEHYTILKMYLYQITELVQEIIGRPDILKPKLYKKKFWK